MSRSSNNDDLVGKKKLGTGLNVYNRCFKVSPLCSPLSRVRNDLQREAALSTSTRSHSRRSDPSVFSGGISSVEMQQTPAPSGIHGGVTATEPVEVRRGFLGRNLSKIFYCMLDKVQKRWKIRHELIGCVIFLLLAEINLSLSLFVYDNWYVALVMGIMIIFMGMNFTLYFVMPRISSVITFFFNLEILVFSCGCYCFTSSYVFIWFVILTPVINLFWKNECFSREIIMFLAWLLSFVLTITDFFAREERMYVADFLTIFLLLHVIYIILIFCHNESLKNRAFEVYLEFILKSFSNLECGGKNKKDANYEKNENMKKKFFLKVRKEESGSFSDIFVDRNLTTRASTRSNECSTKRNSNLRHFFRCFLPFYQVRSPSSFLRSVRAMLKKYRVWMKSKAIALLVSKKNKEIARLLFNYMKQYKTFLPFSIRQENMKKRLQKEIMNTEDSSIYRLASFRDGMTYSFMGHFEGKGTKVRSGLPNFVGGKGRGRGCRAHHSHVLERKFCSYMPQVEASLLMFEIKGIPIMFQYGMTDFELVEFMTVLFNEVIEILEKSQGVLHEVFNCRFLVSFNAVCGCPEYEHHSCLSALRLRELMKKLTLRKVHDLPYKITIISDVVHSGHCGNDSIKMYNFFGDATEHLQMLHEINLRSFKVPGDRENSIFMDENTMLSSQYRFRCLQVDCVKTGHNVYEEKIRRKSWIGRKYWSNNNSFNNLSSHRNNNNNEEIITVLYPHSTPSTSSILSQTPVTSLRNLSGGGHSSSDSDDIISDESLESIEEGGGESSSSYVFEEEVISPDINSNSNNNGSNNNNMTSLTSSRDGSPCRYRNIETVHNRSQIQAVFELLGIRKYKEEEEEENKNKSSSSSSSQEEEKEQENEGRTRRTRPRYGFIEHHIVGEEEIDVEDKEEEEDFLMLNTAWEKYMEGEFEDAEVSLQKVRRLLIERSTHNGSIINQRRDSIGSSGIEEEEEEGGGEGDEEVENRRNNNNSSDSCSGYCVCMEDVGNLRRRMDMSNHVMALDMNKLSCSPFQLS